jgi:hypothetical protein
MGLLLAGNHSVLAQANGTNIRSGSSAIFNIKVGGISLSIVAYEHLHRQI